MFQLNRKAMLKAVDIDKVVDNNESFVRGFVYIMNNSSYLSLQTAGFSPHFVSLSNPHLFLSENSLFNAALLSGSSTPKAMLQDIYANRDEIVRIVYAVSSAHANISSLAKDLNEYGILHRGHPSSPSEQIRFAIFEKCPRDAANNCLFRQTSTSSRPTMNLPHQNLFGLIISMSAVKSKRSYRVALHFSNDIVMVDELDIIHAIEPAVPTAISKSASVFAKYSVGSTIEFRVKKNSQPVENRTSHPDEIHMVEIRVRNPVGQTMVSLVPLVVERYSFPSSAELSIDSIRVSDGGLMREAALTRWAVKLHCFSMRAYLTRLFHDSWFNEYQFISRRIKETMVLNPGDEKEIGSDASYVGAVLPQQNSQLSWMLNTFFVLMKQDIPPSHPLVQCVEWLLTTTWRNIRPLMKGIINNPGSRSAWFEGFSTLLNTWTVRSGLTVEEIYQSLGVRNMFDAEQLNYKYLQLCDTSTGKVHLTSAFISRNGLAHVLKELGIMQSLTAGKEDTSSSFISTGRLNEGNLDSLDSAILILHSSRTLDMALSKINEYSDSGMHFLQSWVEYRAEHSLVALRDAVRVRTDRLSASSRNTLIGDEHESLVGLHTSVRRWNSLSVVPGIDVSIHEVRNSGANPTALDEYAHVLVWSYNHTDEDLPPQYIRNLAAAIEKLQVRLSAMEKLIPVVQLQSGIRFSSSESSNFALTFEWSPRWIFLSDFAARCGGLLVSGKFDLLRIIALNLLNAIRTAQAGGIDLGRSLSPYTIVIDEHSGSVKILLSPLDVDSDTTLAHKFLNHCRNVKQLRPFIPVDNLNFDGPPSKVDNSYGQWSFGMCLYFLAFGEIIHESQCESSGAIIYHLMHKFISKKISKFHIEDDEEKGILAPDARAISFCGTEMKKSIEKIFSCAVPDQLFFQTISYFMCVSLEKLCRCRSIFCQVHTSGMVSEAVLLSRWEKIFLSIYLKVGCCQSNLESIRRSIYNISLNSAEEDSFTEIQKLFGLDLTQREFSELLSALSSVLNSQESSAKSTSGKGNQKLAKALKVLSLLLDEIQHYYNFQQLLYVLTRCIIVHQGVMQTSISGSQSIFNELSRLPIFVDVDENSVLKAQVDLKVLRQSMCSAKTFVDLFLFSSLRTAFACVIGPNATDCSAITSLIPCIKLLEALLPKIGSPSVSTSLRRETGRINYWEDVDYCNVLQNALDSRTLQMISFMTLRLNSLDLAIMTHESKKLLSQYITRVLLMFQNLIQFMASEARQLTIEKLVEKDHSRVEYRRLIDSLLRNTLDAILMLAMGEESPIFLDKREQIFSVSIVYPDLLNHQQGLPSQDFNGNALESRWNERLYKLCDSLLVQVVEESGNGTSTFPLGLEMLKYNDVTTNYLVTSSMLAHVTSCSLSTDDNYFKRGSSYFHSLMQLSRKISRTESKLSSSQYRNTVELSKLNDFSAHAIISTAILMLPLSSVKVVDSDQLGKSSGNVRRNNTDTPVIATEAVHMQRCQALLDFKCAQRLQPFFGTADEVIKISLLKLLMGVLTYCDKLTVSVSLMPPFHKLSHDFTSAGWISGVSDILRSKGASVEVVGYAVACCKLMSRRLEWMRAWTPFQIVPSLCSLSVRPTKSFSGIRASCKDSLRVIAISSPSSIKALLSLRLLPTETSESLLNPTPVSDLLIEARDINFGSTIAEQNKYSESLLSWFGECLSTVNITRRVSTPEEWTLLFELGDFIISWLPQLSSILVTRLLQPLAISKTAAVQQTSSKDKLKMSFEIVTRYIHALKMLCDYCAASSHPQTISLICGCLCGSSLNSENPQVKSTDGGYLRLLETIIDTGNDVDTFIPLKILLQIIQSIANFLSLARKEILQIIYSCDIVRVLFKAFEYCMFIVKEVIRMQREAAFFGVMKDMIVVIREVWFAMLSTGDARMYEDIIDCGIIQKVVEEWMMSDVFLIIPPSTLTGAMTAKLEEENVYNPHLMRHEAMHMLYTIATLMPKTNPLVGEIVRQVLSTDMVSPLCSITNCTLYFCLLYIINYLLYPLLDDRFESSFYCCLV